MENNLQYTYTRLYPESFVVYQETNNINQLYFNYSKKREKVMFFNCD